MTRKARQAIASSAVLLVLVFVVPAGATTAATKPYIQVAPFTVQNGTRLTVYGRGFCGRPSCPRVVLTFDRRWVVRPFHPRPDGRFRVSFPVMHSPGRFTVRAAQTGGGTRLRAVATVIVAVA